MMSHFSFRAACLLLPLVSFALAAPRVAIGKGVFIGTATTALRSSPTGNAYLGIPFAKPPTRFLPAEPAEPLVGEYDATQWPAACMQQSSSPLTTYNASGPVAFSTSVYNTTQSEDCLYLNVFTPTNVTVNSRLPVMFSIYGGNLQGGTSSIVAYNAVPLVSTQIVIVVTINYRVGVFGFVGSEELNTTKRNPGFLDQRLALEWVHQNIRAFGGDPDAVTIFGQSAGGYSIKQLFANPPKPSRFRAAIMQSEASVLQYNDWPTLVDRLNCTNATSPLACVQALPAALVNNVTLQDSTGAVAYSTLTGQLAFPPTVDNVTNTNRPEIAIARGTAAKVPLLIGSNVNETASLVYGLNYTSGEYAFEVGLNSTYAATIYPILYNAAIINGANSPQMGTGHIYNQFLFTCAANLLATTAAINEYPVWRYLYNATFPRLNTYPDQISYGAYHGAEVIDIFGTWPESENPVENERHAALSDYIQGIWAGFAKNPYSALTWPKVNEAPEYLLRIGQDNEANGTVVKNGVVDYDCAWYETLILGLKKL